jgi:hypothetical protein
MYRKPSKKQREAQARRLEAMRRGRERAAMAREPRGRMPELPLLRRELVVIDYDSGQPVTHTLHLYRSDRVDCYRAVADGRPWKDRIGWSKVLAGLRKSYQRVPGARSDFWWEC